MRDPTKTTYGHLIQSYQGFLTSFTSLLKREFLGKAYFQKNLKLIKPFSDSLKLTL